MEECWTVCVACGEGWVGVYDAVGYCIYMWFVYTLEALSKNSGHGKPVASPSAPTDKSLESRVRLNQMRVQGHNLGSQGYRWGLMTRARATRLPKKRINPARPPRNLNLEHLRCCASRTHLLVTPYLEFFGRCPGGAILFPLPSGAMVLGFETVKDIPSTVSPSPSPARSSGAAPDLDPPVAPRLDDGHTAHAHILSHIPAVSPVAEPDPLRAQSNMRSQDGEVEGRPPYLHVGRTRSFFAQSRRTPR
jgi:hypothetical protein